MESLAQALDPERGPIFCTPDPDWSQTLCYAERMQRWNKAPAAIKQVTERLYRPDLLHLAGGTA